MKARKALPADIPEIIGLLDMMHEEIGQWPASPIRISQTVADLMDYGRIGVIDDPDRGAVVGCIGLRGWQPWYTDVAMLSDVFVFLHPDFRTWPNFKALIDVATDLSEEAGLPFILSLYALKDTERKEFLFQRFADQLVRGYQFSPVGGYFKRK
jgi:hypothetical protein